MRFIDNGNEYVSLFDLFVDNGLLDNDAIDLEANFQPIIENEFVDTYELFVPEINKVITVYNA